MIKKIKFLNIIFVLFLVISSPITLMSESKIVEKQQKITNENNATSETSKIEICQYLKDGSLLKISKMISTEQANKLISNLNLLSTENMSFHQKIDFAKKELKEIIDFNESLYKIMIDPDRNILGRTVFFGIGLAAVMGLHGYATLLGLGVHILGLYCFEGVVGIEGGTTPGFSRSGLLFGITIGYMGILTKVMIPNINGIFIFGIGAYLFTSWRKM